jgi:hypothetical protein
MKYRTDHITLTQTFIVPRRIRTIMASGEPAQLWSGISEAFKFLLYY